MVPGTSMVAAFSSRAPIDSGVRSEEKIDMLTLLHYFSQYEVLTVLLISVAHEKFFEAHRNVVIRHVVVMGGRRGHLLCFAILLHPPLPVACS